MIIYDSLLSTWLAFLREELEDDLVRPGTLLKFDCKRTHIYPNVDDGTVPMEISFVIDNPICKDTRIDKASLPTSLLDKWDEFVIVLDHADGKSTLIFNDD